MFPVGFHEYVVYFKSFEYLDKLLQDIDLPNCQVDTNINFLPQSSLLFQ